MKCFVMQNIQYKMIWGWKWLLHSLEGFFPCSFSSPFYTEGELKTWGRPFLLLDQDRIRHSQWSNEAHLFVRPNLAATSPSAQNSSGAPMIPALFSLRWQPHAQQRDFSLLCFWFIFTWLIKILFSMSCLMSKAPYETFYNPCIWESGNYLVKNTQNSKVPVQIHADPCVEPFLRQWLNTQPFWTFSAFNWKETQRSIGQRKINTDLKMLSFSLGGWLSFGGH